jgi:hypothetical protein
MIKACNAAGLQKVGRGSSRVVYAINDKLVIKIALGHAGLSQNKEEMKIHYMLNYDFPGWKKYYAKIYPNLSHPRDMFIIMERVTMSFPGKRKYCKQMMLSRVAPSKVTVRRATLHNNAMQKIDELTFSSNARDCHGGNIGITASGVIKAVDYGLSNTLLRSSYGFFSPRIKKNYLTPHSG